MERIKIKELREAKGFSQEELAKELKVKQHTISRYESGEREPDITTIRKLCKFFNVSSDYLLGIKDEYN